MHRHGGRSSLDRAAPRPGGGGFQRGPGLTGRLVRLHHSSMRDVDQQYLKTRKLVKWCSSGFFCPRASISPCGVVVAYLAFTQKIVGSNPTTEVFFYSGSLHGSRGGETAQAVCWASQKVFKKYISPLPLALPGPSPGGRRPRPNRTARRSPGGSRSSRSGGGAGAPKPPTPLLDRGRWGFPHAGRGRGPWRGWTCGVRSSQQARHTMCSAKSRVRVAWLDVPRAVIPAGPPRDVQCEELQGVPTERHTTHCT